MKKIIVLLALTVSLFAIDSNDVSYAGFSDLSTQDQAEILKIVADKKLAMDKVKAKIPEMPDIETAEKAERWVNIGSSIGKGLASSAQELGIATNKFAESSVGKLTMFLIVFHIIGDNIIHFVGGVIFITIGFIFNTMLLNRRWGWIEKYEDGKIISKSRDKADNEDISGFWFGYAIVLAAGIIIMITG